MEGSPPQPTLHGCPMRALNSSSASALLLPSGSPLLLLLIQERCTFQALRPAPHFFPDALLPNLVGLSGQEKGAWPKTVNQNIPFLAPGLRHWRGHRAQELVSSHETALASRESALPWGLQLRGKRRPAGLCWLQRWWQPLSAPSLPPHGMSQCENGAKAGQVRNTEPQGCV